MNLEILGRQIRTRRKELGISLNKMSNDIYGNRFRVNHLSNIEKGKVDLQFTQLVLIFGYRTTLPCMVYKCENLTKKGSVNKREPFRNIHQTNILTES